MKNRKKITAVHGRLNVTAEVVKEDDMYVAKCRELKVVSQGETPAKALNNLEEAIELYLEGEEFDRVILPLKFTFEFDKIGANR